MHLPVPYLTVPARWRIGPVTFLPPGRLVAMIDRDHAKRPVRPPDLMEWLRRPLLDEPTSTVAVPAWTRFLTTGKVEETALAAARDDARDAIAVLRLFQHHRSTMKTDHETFGLAVDIGSVMEHRYVSDPQGCFILTGVQRHGSIAAWTFSRDDMAAFAADPRFAFIDQALRTPAERRTDWQHRVVLAVRTLGVGVPLDRPSTRIVLAATAIEALVGDAYQPRAGATGGHHLARRAAFAWCGAEFKNPHGQPPGRPACDFLVARGRDDLARRAREVAAGGGALVCDFYASLLDISEARNEAVHGADTRFTTKEADRYEYETEAVVLAVVAWVVDHGATTLTDYLAAIDALPVPPDVAARAAPPNVGGPRRGRSTGQL